MQPGLDETLVAPGHRDQTERRIDGEALADGMLAVGAVADRVDGRQVPVADLRHRAARTERVVQEAQRIAPAVQQRELHPQAVDQTEQAAAQHVAAVLAPRHPGAPFQFGQHQGAGRGADPADLRQLGRCPAVR